MAEYRCYFLGSNGQLVGAETIVSGDDREAVNEARERLARRVYAEDFELRQGSRPVSVHETKAS